MAKMTLSRSTTLAGYKIAGSGYDDMLVHIQFAKRYVSAVRRYWKELFLILASMGIAAGCAPNVRIPDVEQFRVVSGNQTEDIDTRVEGELLLEKLYRLLKANEGVEVPVCTADRVSRQCIKDGVRVFVFGGFIPGSGKRYCYIFNDASLENQKLLFSKDNRCTKFIGTPMSVRPNKCTVSPKGGGLQVEMATYYANWAGVGNMTMAEGWAIDYLDLDQGIVGLQLALDIKGFLVAGGGSRYVLLRFPNVP